MVDFLTEQARLCATKACACHIAEFEQRCQRCWHQIQVGSHIVRRPNGWCHTECPEQAKGVLVAQEEVVDPREPLAGSMAPGPISLPTKRMTEEQQVIVDCQVRPGHRMRVTAVAGAGKTTTCILIAKRFLKNHPDIRIAYVVFNEKAREEASARFPKEVAVFTSHALARKIVWPQPRSIGEPKLEDIVSQFQLLGHASDKFGNILERQASDISEDEKRKTRQILMKKARMEATFIMKTLNNFLWSDSTSVNEQHVFWRAKIKTKVPAGLKHILNGKKEVDPLHPSFYFERAQILFKRMCCPEDDIFPMTHDGYLKLYQLTFPDIGPNMVPLCQNRACQLQGQPMRTSHGRFGRFCKCTCCGNRGELGWDVVITDESQDFTPCQSCALWGGSAAIYMVGDARQRIYRWRGAQEAFENSSCSHDLGLTESFRFGASIAKAANNVLDFASNGRDGKVRGRSSQEGIVVAAGEQLPQSVASRLRCPEVVITRSNKGMFDELVRHVRDAGFPRWAFIDGKMCKYLITATGFIPYLNLKFEKCEEVRLKGEVFTDWEELQEFVADEGDARMSTMMELVEEYGEEVLDLVDQIRNCQVSDWREADIALITAHKSKGLEFQDVRLACDYNLPIEEGNLLPPDRIQRPYWQEELNILYVAITRTCEVLRLSNDIEQFMRLIGHTQRPTVLPSVPLLPSEKLKERRIQDEVRWKLFEQACQDLQKSFVADVASVPWPSGPESNILALDSTMHQEDVRLVVHRALLRYHPDKFMARYGLHVPPEQHRPGSVLLQKLAEITRASQELKKEFCVEAGGGDRELALEPAASPPECILCCETYTEELLRTDCCKQRICSGCYAQDVGRKSGSGQESSCPFCRKLGYECHPMRPIANQCRRDDHQAIRDRSRSPR